MTEHDVVQLFPLQQPPLPLQQLPLQLLHIPLPLVDLAHTHGEVLLLLDDSAGPGLGRCVQLVHVGKGPLGVDVTLVDGPHLQIEAALLCPCHRPLEDRHLLKHGGPQLEAPTLIVETLAFPVQGTLHFGHGLIHKAHRGGRTGCLGRR
jgi:hypothetical protein